MATLPSIRSGGPGAREEQERSDRRITARVSVRACAEGGEGRSAGRGGICPPLCAALPREKQKRSDRGITALVSVRACCEGGEGRSAGRGGICPPLCAALPREEACWGASSSASDCRRTASP